MAFLVLTFFWFFPLLFATGVAVMGPSFTLKPFIVDFPEEASSILIAGTYGALHLVLFSLAFLFLFMHSFHLLYRLIIFVSFSLLLLSLPLLFCL